jgi:hypothetical protein
MVLFRLILHPFNTIVAKDCIVLNIGGLNDLDSLPAYLEKWHMQLWDFAFLVIFKGVSPFLKTNVFANYHGATFLEKKVIYR